ncbi:hypothetical protein [Actinoplanes sp. L3-i22]|uniref:hypothetical protein n=1 Tax=Actinoplanes sp. L3-i22 TaxID=2836373 RepID=UPI001C74BF52|nr:hypothetical protein [Actinoplanes sp. L3-i22]BCY08930.1 hypothetical protein L3i22_040180 [Actinoplanes sp. L3-i22]
MTDPEPERMQPGHWLLIGLITLLVVGVAAVTVLRRDQDPDVRAAGVTIAPTASSPASPVCVPEVAETGQSQREGLVSFGIVLTSDCPQATVAGLLNVVAIGADGTVLKGDQAEAGILLPAVLPGQRVGLGGMLLVGFDASVKSIRASFSDTQNMPVSAFSSWPAVHVTDIKHRGPDSSGHTQVTGVLVTEPNTAKLCNPRYFLLLRNTAGALIYGVETYKEKPFFDERLPTGIDWSKTEISVVMGVPGLSPVSPARVTCQ